ncbi:MAG TPA: hypothetical protein VL202_12300 [Pararhizobium sp.]|uniref:hypothetical protein n=1 Tax=Pararhizobium sp. TaxID=1977563 RepID=UPI002CBBE5F2|nr:hypothetical protein [Pararhizobium sp.]HTO31943.1 hypothetical protein [Pararhizobium sp.]
MLEGAAGKEIQLLDDDDRIVHHESVRRMHDEMVGRALELGGFDGTLPSFGPGSTELKMGLTEMSPAMMPTG